MENSIHCSRCNYLTHNIPLKPYFFHVLHCNDILFKLLYFTLCCSHYKYNGIYLALISHISLQLLNASLSSHQTSESGPHKNALTQTETPSVSVYQGRTQESFFIVTLKKSRIFFSVPLNKPVVFLYCTYKKYFCWNKR